MPVLGFGVTGEFQLMQERADDLLLNVERLVIEHGPEVFEVSAEVSDFAAHLKMPGVGTKEDVFEKLRFGGMAAAEFLNAEEGAEVFGFDAIEFGLATAMQFSDQGISHLGHHDFQPMTCFGVRTTIPAFRGAEGTGRGDVEIEMAAFLAAFAHAEFLGEGFEGQDVIGADAEVGIGAVEGGIEPQMNGGGAKDDDGFAVAGKPLRHGLEKAVDLFADGRVPVRRCVAPVHGVKGLLPAEPDAFFFLQADEVHGLVDEAIADAGIFDELFGKADPLRTGAQALAAEDAGDDEGLVVIVVRRAGQIQLPDALPTLHRGRGDLLTREAREFGKLGCGDGRHGTIMASIWRKSSLPCGHSMLLAPRSMLSDLFVRDFRCFAEAKVELHPDVTLLVGRNAQGKTSLIEAACVLMRLQSPRTTNRSELVRFEASTCLVEAAWSGKRLRYAQNATSRRLALDGVTCGKSADYLAAAGLVVWMDHRDMNLLRGGAEHRRRFLDFAASQMFPDYLHSLRGYERALRGRNYVLKRDAVIAWKQADAFARVMDGFAAVLWQRRAELCAALNPQVSAAHAHLSEGAENTRIAFSSTWEAGSLFEALAGMREEESKTRSTAFGPHRDDIAMFLNERDATSFASEGQQRSFALAMKLAQAHVLEKARGEAPLMLIDDVFGELDAFRRRALLSLLPNGTQKIITTTNLDWAEKDALNGVVHQVEQGAMSRVKAGKTAHLVGIEPK